MSDNIEDDKTIVENNYSIRDEDFNLTSYQNFWYPYEVLKQWKLQTDENETKYVQDNNYSILGKSKNIDNEKDNLLYFYETFSIEGDEDNLNIDYFLKDAKDKGE